MPRIPFVRVRTMCFVVFSECILVFKFWNCNFTHTSHALCHSREGGNPVKHGFLILFEKL